ncbi:MAG: electron transfer flavoprotein subunit alpha/FixB family protein [Deltaproteobacteria bacterium]|nr:electron transfer flavoprotein subunit alpha/FixB family protein [Deltaproteobacteria bacterium]
MLPEIWSYIETEDGSPDDTAYMMAAESRRTAGIFNAEACAVIFGSPALKILEELKWYGLKKVYLFKIASRLSPEGIARALHKAALKYNPQFLLFADTPSGSEVAARTAASLKRGLISNCIDFESEDGKPIARKAVYNGKAHAAFAWESYSPYLATINLSSLENAKEKNKNNPELISEEVKTESAITTLIRKWEVRRSELDLCEARVVIGVGRGVDVHFMETIRRLADLIQGVIGGSRIAVYTGLIPLDRQIGTTGKWLNSDIYFTIGISGAPQHVMGIKGVKKIIALDIAKQAPIFRYAKLGIIGDMHEVIPKLINLLESDAKRDP